MDDDDESIPHNDGIAIADHLRRVGGVGPNIPPPVDGVIINDVAVHLQLMGGVGPNIPPPFNGVIIDLRSIGHVSASSTSSLSSMGYSESREANSHHSRPDGSCCDDDNLSEETANDTSNDGEVEENSCNENRNVLPDYVKLQYPDLFDSSSSESEQSCLQKNAAAAADASSSLKQDQDHQLDESREPTKGCPLLDLFDSLSDAEQSRSESNATHDASSSLKKDQDHQLDESQEPTKRDPIIDLFHSSSDGEQSDKDHQLDDSQESWETCPTFGVQMKPPSDDRLEQNQSVTFITDLGMKTFTDIESIGVLMDVSPNGNCFYYAIMMGLFHLHTPPFYLATGSDEDKLLHLKMNLSDVTEFRKQMFRCLLEHNQQFTSPDATIRSVHNSAGIRWKDYSADPNDLLYKKDLAGALLYDDSVDFNNGCRQYHWADIAKHLPIAAFTHKKSMMVYSHFTIRGNSERITTLAHYSDGTVTMHPNLGGWYTPPPGDCITLLMVSACHFQYVRPTSTHSIVPNDFGLSFKSYTATSPSANDMNHCKMNVEGDVQSDGNAKKHRRRVKNPYRKGGDVNVSEMDVDAKNNDDAKNDEDASQCAAKPSQLSLDSAAKLLGGKGKMSSFPHFCEEVNIADVPHHRYREFVSEVFTTKVSGLELIGKVVAEHDGTNLTNVVIAPGSAKNFGEFFRSEIVKGDNFPRHVVLRGQKATSTSILKKGRGKRPLHPYLAYVSGWCAGSQKRKKRSSNEHEGCTTKWVGGIDEENLLLFAKKPTDCTIEMSITISGYCLHNKYKMYGQLRGAEREKAVREVKSMS